MDVDKDGLMRDWVHIVPVGYSKAKYVRENIAPEVDFVVDDNPHVIEDFVKTGVSKWTFMIDKPWNRKHVDLNTHRITHISQVLNPIRFY